MSESRLRNLYLPPFKAAIDAGADTVMCSFNTINGVPGCANKYTETDILKKEWGFDGFIESDYTAVAELRACPPVRPDEGPCGHGVAADGPAGRRRGADGRHRLGDGEHQPPRLRRRSCSPAGRSRCRRLDDAVRRILRVKFRAGLFDDPYVDVAKAADPASYGQPADLEKSRWAAGRSMVLLKNDAERAAARPGEVHRPHRALRRQRRRRARPVVRTGLRTTSPRSTSPLVDGLRAASTGGGHLHRRRATWRTTSTRPTTPTRRSPPRTRCARDRAPTAPRSQDAVAAANAADQVVLALGENAFMSGESNARSQLDLPGRPGGPARRGGGHRQAAWSWCCSTAARST